MVTHRCSDDLELAKENLPKIRLWCETRRRATGEHAPASARRAQAPNPRVGADIVHHHIDTALVRQVTDFPVELLGFVIDHEICAKLARSFELFITARSREDAATHHLRNLNRGCSNARSGAQNQHIL